MYNVRDWMLSLPHAAVLTSAHSKVPRSNKRCFFCDNYTEMKRVDWGDDSSCSQATAQYVSVKLALMGVDLLMLSFMLCGQNVRAKALN